MTNAPEFEAMLTGGHPNSLGRTLEVVALIEEEPARMEEAYRCYQSNDPVVRLRTSNIFKRLIRAQPSRYTHWASRLIDEVAAIEQDSARWTVAQIIGENLDLWDQHDDALKQRSLTMLFGLFDKTDDWIVTNATLKTLANIGVRRMDVEARLRPLLEIYQDDRRKSVSNTARKAAKALDTGKAIK